MELVQSAVDGGHRLLVFSQFTSMLDILSARLDGEHVEHFMITGSTPKEKRLQLVNAFNGGAVPVFLISLKAGGVGLNLTGADMVSITIPGGTWRPRTRPQTVPTGSVSRKM